MYLALNNRVHSNLKIYDYPAGKAKKHGFKMQAKFVILKSQLSEEIHRQRPQHDDMTMVAMKIIGNNGMLR